MNNHLVEFIPNQCVTEIPGLNMPSAKVIRIG
jgi:hypothetical protein